MLTRIFTATAVASLALGLAAACSPPATPTEAASADTADMVKMALPHAKMANFTLKDTAGKAHELYKMTDAKAIVISMHTRGCPIGQQLNPDFHALQAKYEAKGVKFMMINPNMHDTPEMIAKEAKEFDITMPILKDSDQSVTEPWGVERATETLIVEPKTWKILYQGPINDRVTFGRAKAKPDNDFATVTLDAMLAGKAVTPSYNMTDGCIISFEKRGH
ncbi:MAG: redoxin domain-containing protein [Hyphomonadaceae bacterium]|nr:redoxin domain-containing protein [Hyphomonadaceae bacterium]